jgi:predicted nucleic acid-binding protein
VSADESVPFVFDAEPLLALAFEEPGKDRVAELLREIDRGEVPGLLNAINACEVHYWIVRKRGRSRADRFVRALGARGLDLIESVSMWPTASAVIVEYNPSLADAFALATAIEHNGVLIAGGDDDWDDPIADGHAIERFRAGSS